MAAACMVSNAPAAPVIWSGGDLVNGNTNWSDTANWYGGAVPGSSSDVKLFDAGAVATASNIDNLVDVSTTIGSLQFGNTNNNHTTWITNGATLNVTGSGLTVGTFTTPSLSQKVYATVVGAGGTLNLNNNGAYIVIDQGTNTASGGTGMRATLDLSGLDNFVANVFRIGVGDYAVGGANNAQSTTGTLLLAKTNTITTISQGTGISLNVALPTNAVVVGCDNGNAGGVNFLYLGQTNGFFIDSIGVGTLKTTASMLFNPGFVNPTAYFCGTNGGTSRVRFWSIGDMSSSGSSSANCNGTNDFTGGTVNAFVDTMSLARDRQGGNTGSTVTKGTLIFGAGTINVNTIYIGNQFFTAAANSNPMNGIVNVNGTGILQVNTTLTLGNTAVNSTAAQATFGVLSVTNGTVYANNITVGAFTTSANNAINLSGATLIVTNSLATNATGLAAFNIGNSTLGLTVTTNAFLDGLVKTLTTSGTTNVIQFASVPVFSSYPRIIPLIQYTTLNGTFNFGLTNVPASAPGAYLTNITTVPQSVALVLPNDPRPVITNEPSSYSGNPGDNVTTNFSVIINGNSVMPLAYQWYSIIGGVTNTLTDGANVSGSTNFGSATASLIISNAQPADSGNYYVIVTNLYGSATSSPLAVLTISASAIAPTVGGPTNLTVIAGNNATINDSVSGSPVPALQWYDQTGAPIPSATTASLTLNNVQYSQNGYTYSLIATNSAGLATNITTLTVIVPPVITQQPTNVVVTNTQTASFSVQASGVPAVAYQWKKNGSPMSDNGNISGSSSSNLSFVAVSPSDIAAYSCTITNLAGSTNSASVTLTVNSTMATTALTPTNGATGICYDTPLYITFSSTPTLRNAGKIRIYNVTNSATPVDTLDMSLNATPYPGLAAAQPRSIGGDTFTNYPVIITGNTAAIYPHLDLLASNQTYYVTIDDGVFADASGAYFAGISATNVWQFTTKAGGPANPTNLVVAADGSGDFLTVQGAVDSVPANNTTPTLINIRNGTYTGIVDVKSKNSLDFRGQSRNGAIVSYANNNNLNGTGAPLRAMFVMNGSNCTFENLTLTNTTPHGGSQAEAIDVEATQCILYNMELDSYQDTFLVHSAGKLVYFQDCLIQGDTDFNWGYGTVFYTNCVVNMLTTGGHVTQPRAPFGQNGFSFVNCSITAGSGSVTSGDLGRSINTPTTPANVIFVTCLMGDFITGYSSDAGTNFWTCSNSNLTATVQKTGLAYATELPLSSPVVVAAQSATNWLYGWVPQVAPNILTNPVGQSISGGGTVTFTVAATGISAPAYQWLKNGTPISGQTGSSLTISSASANDAAAYSVIVSNSVGVVTSGSASLTVANTAPTLAPVSDQTVNVGVNVSVANVATDPDVPAQTLTFSLLNGPASAAVNSSSGIFTWRPTVSFAGTSNPVQVVVTDNGTPNLSATNSFNVIVNPLTQPVASTPAYSGGQFTVTVSGQIGPDYELQGATNLAGGSWTDIATTNSPASSPFMLTDPNAAAQPAQYYRIVVGPPLP
jgi:pectin methylesterase-like acyl-CoA thioesterase